MHERWPWSLEKDSRPIIIEFFIGGERANYKPAGPQGPQSKEEKE